MARFLSPSRLGPAALGLFLLGPLVGCGRGESAEERQMAQMREDMNRLQGDRDRVDQRLSALELRAADDAKDTKAAARRADPAGPTPPLRVVRLAPDGSQVAEGPTLDGDDPEDTTPRPTIKVAGTADSSSHAKRRAGHRDDVVEETMPPESANGGTAGPAVHADPTRASALDPEARKSYDAALALVHNKKYPEALDALAGFLLRWPDHPFASNAMYWRGECYFAQGDLARAAEQFDGTVARFPLSNKASDALLKLGLTRQKLGDAAGAQTAFDRLTREFPKSEAAHRIPGVKP